MPSSAKHLDAQHLDAQHFDVIIVGCGPVGVAASCLLAQRGLSVGAVDRDVDVYPLPRAAFFDGEISRLYQELGIKERVNEFATPGKGAGFYGAGGKVLNELRLPEGFVGASGFPEHNLFHQPSVDRLLRARAVELGVVHYLGHTAAMPEQNKDEVHVMIRHNETHETTRLSADYLIAADGANSAIRKGLGIAWHSLGYDRDWLVMDVLLKDRKDHKDHDIKLPDIAIQYCDPQRIHTFVPMCGDRRRWEFILNEGETWEEMRDEKKQWELLADFLTPAQAEIERSAVYQFHASIAERWRVGRIFLMGDAAHQMPPFLGQGMCTGLRDAANLAWKLDCVKRGLMPASILDTYAIEREPHALDIVDHAVAIGKLMDALAQAHHTGDWPEDMSAVYGGSRGMPRLHDGLLAKEAHGEVKEPIGSLAPQPLVQLNGGGAAPLLLDDITGANFVIMSAQPIADALQPFHRVFLEKIGAKMITLPQEARKSDLADFILSQNEAVIVRPDHYIYGLANKDHLLSNLIEELEGFFK